LPFLRLRSLHLCPAALSGSASAALRRACRRAAGRQPAAGPPDPAAKAHHLGPWAWPIRPCARPDSRSIMSAWG